jgi:glycerol kinase
MSTTRLGIDFGTTQIKAIQTKKSGETVSIETIPTPTDSRNGRITHPPDLMLKRTRQIPERFGLTGSWEAAIASQRSTFILWDPRTGNRLTPLISWRDRRGADWIQNLSDQQVDRIQEITGLRPEAGYPLSKLKWIFDENPRLLKKARNDEVRYGSLDTWLLWHATGGEYYRMVPTQASRTLLYDPIENEWSRELLDEFDIPPAIFPEVAPDSLPDRLDAGNLWDNSKIISLIGDQPAATIGGQPPPYEQTRVTLGTAGFVSDPCEPENCPDRLTVGFTPTRMDRVFQAEGVVLSAGKAIDWIIRVLGINHSTFEEWIKPPWPDEIPLWSPSLNGVGAPHWKNRKATLDFLTESTSTREICQGLVVSILQRVRDILEYLPERQNRRVLLDGGMTAFNNVDTLAASLWDEPAARTLNPHLTCRGALIASHWKDSYFTGDPWEDLNVEVLIPDRAVPGDVWNQRWDEALAKWGMNRP